jgi:uncharacterized protein
MNWMQTFTGRKVDLEYPRPEDIDIRDIAHALSQICRYGGHCHKFYSVAEHSLLVADVIEANYASFKPIELAGLLHDAAEAYLGDLITPLKKILTKETSIEGRWLDVIKERFALPVDLNPLPNIVKSADQFMLAVEVHDLFPIVLPDWKIPKTLPMIPPHLHPKCLPPAQAKEAFLARFQVLTDLS